MCAVVTKDLGVDYLILMKKKLPLTGFEPATVHFAKIKGYGRCALSTELAGTHIIFHNSYTFYCFGLITARG